MLTRTYLIENKDANLANKEIIELVARDLITIDVNTFDGLNKLVKLDLSKNNIEAIPNKAFKDLSNLKVLCLIRNKIKEINADSFEGLTKLENLNLSINKIEVIPKKAFKDLSSLIFLALRNNGLSVIDENTFEGLLNLENLDLIANEIKTIPERTFSMLSNLKKLCLNRNRLEQINENSFDGLNKLEILNISTNEIEEIGETAFNQLSRLKSLDAHRNRIKKIGFRSFERLSKLEKLDLSNNESKQINENTFNNLKRLKELYFYNNPIETNEMQFSNLVNLEWMTLSTQNDIGLKEMLYLLFRKLKKLRFICIIPLIESSNNVFNLLKKSAPNSACQIYVRNFADINNVLKFQTRSKAAKFFQLEILYTERLYLNINPYLFVSSFPILKYFYIYLNNPKFNKQNELKELFTNDYRLLLYKDEKMLEILEKLTLYRIQPTDLKNESFFEKLKNLKKLILIENDIKDFIDCKLLEKATKLESLDLSLNKIRKIDSNIYKRNIELYLACNTIKQLEPSSYKEINLKLLSLYENRIIKIDSDYYINFSVLKSLDLGNNKISKIEKNTFNGLHKLEILCLQDNFISEIENDSFESLKMLKELNLNGNDLKKIESETFKHLSKLERLDLGRNEISMIDTFIVLRSL